MIILPAARLELAITIEAAAAVITTTATAAAGRQYFYLQNAAGAMVL